MDKQAVARTALVAAAEEDERHHAQQRAENDALRSWHLVQISAKQSTLAKHHLERSGYGFYYPQLRTLFVPPARKLSRAQRKMRHLMVREKIEPFFPGYSFVRFDVQRDPWHDIFKLVGVYGIACEQNMPRVMSDEFISQLKNREVNGAIPGETPVEEIFLRVGDEARFHSGPLSGFTGRVDHIDSNGRIRLLLPLFGSVETFLDEVDKAPATHLATG